MEPLPREVYLTNVWGALEGWQMDGPGFPSQQRYRQYENRWVRFGCTSTARFYRDHTQPGQLRSELAGWALRNPGMRTEDHAHIMPSLIRLSSLLLGSPIGELVQLAGEAPVEDWKGHQESTASTFAILLSALRTEGDTAYDRLIPKSGDRYPFVMGLERSVENIWSCSVQRAIAEIEGQEGGFWPVTVWDEWAPPVRAKGMPGAEKFSFGAVSVPGYEPTGFHSLPVNWNSTLAWLEVRACSHDPCPKATN
jgi:hypothetical protein